MMRADVRRDGMLRPDLLQAPPRSSSARLSVGPAARSLPRTSGKKASAAYAARGYHPNTFWGGYSDYYGFGTDEFLGLCRKLEAEPLIVLAAPGIEIRAG